MPSYFETVTDLETGVETLRRRRYGVIDVQHGRLVGLCFRPWPKISTVFSILWGLVYHRYATGDRMRLYFNQPARYPNFLALRFALSARQTTLATARKALEVLDEIARIKGSDAILCDAANIRLSPRMLARYGWQPHAPRPFHRNYIKRLYLADAPEDEAADDAMLAAATAGEA